MKHSTDFTQLPDYERIKITPVFRAFVTALEGRDVGGEALLDAWAYFRLGYKTGRVELLNELLEEHGFEFKLVPA